MPVFVSWQADFLSLQLADQPGPKQVLTNANQVADSLQVFARTAEQLPQLVERERTAALQQVFTGVATERSNILAAPASEEEKMRDLLAETRSTLATANEMAVSVNAGVQSLDSFVRYVAPRKTNGVADPT